MENELMEKGHKANQSNQLRSDNVNSHVNDHDPSGLFAVDLFTRPVVTKFTRNKPKTNKGPVSREKNTQTHLERVFDDQFNMEDEKLAQDIQEAIEREMFLAVVANDILVTVENGMVTLEGKVFTKQEKLMAGDKAVDFAGFGMVNNELEVTDPDHQ
jgi:hypothetical protein